MTKEDPSQEESIIKTFNQVWQKQFFEYCKQPDVMEKNMECWKAMMDKTQQFMQQSSSTTKEDEGNAQPDAPSPLSQRTDDTVERLRARIATLEQRVQQLEQRANT